jgi:hypothetical protein
MFPSIRRRDPVELLNGITAIRLALVVSQGAEILLLAV